MRQHTRSQGCPIFVPRVPTRRSCTTPNYTGINGRGPGLVDNIGAVGEDGADPEDAKDAARVCALNALAAAASVAGGIDNLAGVVKVVGFVSSRPDFYGQAGVINGASELFGEIFGSQHARSAVGVAALPLNVSVEVEAEFLIK